MVSEDSVEKGEQFRPNVIAVLQHQSQILSFERMDLPGVWQTCQGGMEPQETALQALRRELMEEVGLSWNQVRLCVASQFWRRYRFPQTILEKMARQDPKKAAYVGQEQMWFWIQVPNLKHINLNPPLTQAPEFSRFRLGALPDFCKGFPEWKRIGLEDFLKEIGPDKWLHSWS